MSHFNMKNALVSLYESLMKPASKAALPPTVEWLLAHRQQQRAQTAGETPLASLYRMYEYIVLGYNAGLRTEIEWFFNHPSWAVAAIPDPKDRDPARYAILSVIPQFLTRAFNRLIEKGLPRGSPAIICGDEAEEELKSKAVVLESLPSWVANVPKLMQELVIPNADGSIPEKRDWSPQFLAKNIVVSQPHTLFV
ncbi:Nn.00g058570.m01.CDS01 [Neocucurbitaria sp. VM-36]